MGRGQAKSFFFILLLLFLCVPPAWTQQSEWTRRMEAAKQAEEEGKVQLAEEHYRAAVKEAERLGPDEGLLGTALNHLAYFYHVQERFAEAEQAYEKALPLLRKKLGDRNDEVAGALANLGTVQLNIRKWSKAEKNLKRALKIRQSNFGAKSVELVPLLESLAWIYLMDSRPVQWSSVDYALASPDPFNRSDEAESTLKRLIAIRVRKFGPEHPDVIATLDRLANLFHRIDRPREAIDTYSRTLAIRNKQNDRSDAWLDNVLNLAEQLFAQERYREAKALLELGLTELNIRQPDSRASIVAACYLGEVYRRQKRYAEAEQLFQASLERLQKMPEERLAKVWVMRKYALLLWSTKRLPEVRQMKARARALLPDRYDTYLPSLTRSEP